MRTKTIFVVNKGPHNFKPAEGFGVLHFITTGTISRYSTGRMVRDIQKALANSKPDDYLLPASLSTMNMIAGILFVLKHKRLNLLLFKDGRYIERQMDFSDFA